MGQLLRATELVELAILVEKNGEKFYSSLSDSAASEALREVFAHLAREEERHVGVFQSLLGPLQKYEPIETHSREYEAYVKAVADSHVFIKKEAGEESFRNPLEAIDIAVRFEKDTILFFEAMRRFIPEPEHKVVNELTNEERKHIVKLKELRETLGEEE